MKHVYIIAEAGVNHNGSLTLACEMVAAAAQIGADAVKFQTFTADALASISAGKAPYQAHTTGTAESQYDMLKKLELNYHAFKTIYDACKQNRIDFLSSPFDLNSVDMLVQLGVETIKIPSGEITNLPYLRKIGGLGKNVIMSTGMANLNEVGAALNILIQSGTERKKITLLQCTTEYPAPLSEVNLRAMMTMRDTFGTAVGYSDHTPGIEVPIAAAALGASVIEKHFTLDKSLPGPDHKASLEPDEMKLMVLAIRNIELALGTGIKTPSPSELKNIPVVRKSIIAAQNIKKGEVFSKENLTVKRPGTGISPMEWDSIIGKPAPHDYFTDEIVKL